MPDLSSSGDMKADWNRRAVEDARFFIDTGHAGSEGDFDASGRRDVARFFAGSEDLLLPAAATPPTAVEIGCGVGRMSRHVAPRVGRLICCDVSSEMLRRAAARLADLPNVAFLETDGRTLRPLADDSADLVFSAVVLQHVPRAVAASYVADARRVLKPGGRLLLHLPGPGPGAPLPPEPPAEDTWALRYYSASELRSGLAAAGFEVEACDELPIPEEDARVVALVVRARKPA